MFHIINELNGEGGRENIEKANSKIVEENLYIDSQAIYKIKLEIQLNNLKTCINNMY